MSGLAAPAPKASGPLAAHYAPRATVRLLSVAQMQAKLGAVPLAAGHRVAIWSHTVVQGLGNLTLTADLLHTPWINPVYWTLAIELQYYLLIGLVFPWLVSAQRGRRYAAMALWLLAPWLGPLPATVWTYAALFGMGVFAFMQANRLITMRTCAGLLMVAAASRLQRWRTRLMRPPLRFWCASLRVSVLVASAPVAVVEAALAAVAAVAVAATAAVAATLSSHSSISSTSAVCASPARLRVPACPRSPHPIPA